ncbi:MAG: enoyl-CoA hydratase-related protein [Terricaulis sp.]
MSPLSGGAHGVRESKIETAGGVALITMSDPDTLNSIDPGMVGELADAFNRATREARCAVLTGEGRGFSSGANLSASGQVAAEEGRIDVGQRLESLIIRSSPCCANSRSPSSPP